MLENFSNIISTAQRQQLSSRRCLLEAVCPDDWQELHGQIEAAALQLLSDCCANRFWFWHLLEQSARHAIGPRIQLAHVVNAISGLRRNNEYCLLKASIDSLSREELASLVAAGAVLVSDEDSTPTFTANPIFQAGFDPVEKAARLCGSW
jgi:hypothetical protein